MEVGRVGLPVLVVPFGGEFSGAPSYVVNDERSLDVVIELALGDSYPPARAHVIHRDGEWWEADRRLLLLWG